MKATLAPAPNAPRAGTTEILLIVGVGGVGGAGGVTGLTGVAGVLLLDEPPPHPAIKNKGKSAIESSL
jgi:hypothetical protein